MPGPFARAKVIAQFWMAFKVYPFWRDKSSGARNGFAGSGRIAPPGKLRQAMRVWRTPEQDDMMPKVYAASSTGGDTVFLEAMSWMDVERYLAQ